MSIVIKTEKIVSGNGELSRKFTGIELLPVDKLPEEYLNWKDGGKRLAVYAKGEGEHKYLYFAGCMRYHHPDLPESDRVDVNQKMSEPQFQLLLAVLRRCGDKLHEINESQAKKRLEWQGEETFII